MGALIVLTAAVAAQATTASPQPAPPSDTTAPARTAGSQTYVDLEAGAGYSTNSQLSVNSRSGSGFGRVAVHAVHTRTSARTTTLLSAYAENVTYTSHYGSNQSLSFLGSHEAAVSEHLHVFGNLSGSYEQGGQLDTRILLVPVVPPLSGPPGTPIIIPSGSDFLTVRGKVYNLAAHVGANVSLSSRDSFGVSSGVERTIFHGGSGQTSYTSVPVSLQYSHQLSERATVGAALAAEDTEYNGPGSVRVITPELTGTLRLSPTISFNGAVGVSFARVDNGIIARNSTGLSANASVCSITESGSLCGDFAIGQEVATTAGPTKSISAGVEYSRRLDADSTLSFTLGVNHYSSTVDLVIAQPFSHATYYRASAEYSRRIGRRLFGGVDLSARKLAQAGPDPNTDVSGSLFIRYRLGDVQ